MIEKMKRIFDRVNNFLPPLDGKPEKEEPDFIELALAGFFF